MKKGTHLFSEKAKKGTHLFSEKGDALIFG